MVKQRETYKLDGAKIEIDQVEDLGRFVEIEILTDQDDDNSFERVKQLANYLGIEKTDFISLRYPEMIWQKQGVVIGSLFNPNIHNI